MSKFIEKYGKKISIGITVVVIILAFIGSYQYYTGYVEEVVYDRLWSSVVFSALQLYLFSPTVGPGSATPICYEIAKWTAPLCTAYWIFRAVESLFHHEAAVFRRMKSRRKQILVFGYNETSGIFLQNLEKDKKDYFPVLIADQNLEKETRLSLERAGILVYQADLTGRELSKNEEKFRHFHVEEADEIILFYEDPTWNFTLLKQLTEWAQKAGRTGAKGRPKEVSCAVWCEDPTMKKIITDYYDQLEGKRPWNLNIFGLPEMAAWELFEREPLYKNCLEWAKKAAGEPDARAEREPDSGKTDAGTFMEKIPQPHLLIIGFGRYGQAVFENALLTGVLSDRSKVPGFEKLRVTIIDKEAAWCRQLVESKYPRIDKICHMDYIDSDISCARMEKLLFRLPQVTYIAVCFSDQTACVNTMEKAQTYLSAAEACQIEIPVAVRMKTDGDIIQYWNPGQETHDKRFSFGNMKQILTREHVIRPHVEEAAKEYHVEYQWLQEHIFGAGTFGPQNSGQQNSGQQRSGPQRSGPQSLDPQNSNSVLENEASYKRNKKDEFWNSLSYELKESCRAQVLNRRYFQELQKQLGELPKQEEALTFDIRALFQTFSRYPALELLAALEHKRWCTFCYCRGYVGYHPDEKEKRRIHVLEQDGEVFCGKVHNCLIDDWEEMKADEKVNGTIIYDACSVYGYIKSKEKSEGESDE